MRKTKKKTVIIFGAIAVWLLFAFACAASGGFFLFLYIALTVVLALAALIVLSHVKTVRTVMGLLGIKGGGTTRRSRQADTPLAVSRDAPLFEIPNVSPELLSQIGEERKKSRICFILCGVCAVAEVIGGFTGLSIIMILATISGAVLLISGFRYQKKAGKIFKDNIVRDALGSVFDDLDYQPKAKLDLLALGFFKGQTDQSGGDYINAVYRNRAFEQSDNEIRRIIQWVDKDGNDKSSMGILFRGRAMELAYNTSVDAVTHVISHDFKNAHANRDGWEKIQTELASFHDSFDVYTTDSVSAMTALVPPMLESIMRLNAVINRPMAFSFQNDRIHIMISMSEGENAFEAFASHSDEKSMQKLGYDIQFIRDVLHNLYTK